MGFIDTADYPWFTKVAERWQEVAEELATVDRWISYGHLDMNTPSGEAVGEYLDGGWSIYPAYAGLWAEGPAFEHLCRQGGIERDEAIAIRESLPGRFPATRELLKDIPCINYAAFSRMHPRTMLETHEHAQPDNHICHIGLQLPADGAAAITVDGETHTWRDSGQVIVFDDDQPHASWNKSDDDRYILFINFSRAVNARMTVEHRFAEYTASLGFA